MGEGRGEGDLVNKLNRFAKNLRTQSTDTEKLLWRHLRAKQFEGLKFRRQQPIGRYIVDFVCFEKKIVIECDGGQHSLDRRKDQKRDRWFREQGFRVLRFWDNEVLQNIEEVLRVIQSECRDHPPLLSPPIEGGES